MVTPSAMSCVALAHAHLLVDEGEFGAGVGAKNFAGVFRFPDDDALPGLAQNLGHVGEVVLAVGIGGGEFFDVRETTAVRRRRRIRH